MPGTEPATIDRGRSAALTALGQAFVLLGASMIGVVVAATLAPGARLDAYVNANQVAVAALYVGQGLRTSVPALAVGGVARIAVLARAAVLLTGAVGLVLLLGVVAGPLLIPSDSRGAMRSDLLVLLPGAIFQVWAGYGAGRLAMKGKFAGAALAYAAGTIVNGVLLAALIRIDGAGALAPTALIGWVTSASVIALMLLRETRRETVNKAPEATEAAQQGVGVMGAMTRVALSLTPVLAAQLLIVTAVAASSHTRTGGSSVFYYAYLAVNAVGTVAVAPIPIVLSADLGSVWDRRPETLLPLMLSVVRLSVVVTMPLLIGLFLVGQPVASRFLAGLAPADIREIFGVLAVLCVSLPVTAASMVALIAAFALDRLAAVSRSVCVACSAGTAALIIAVACGASMQVLSGLASAGALALGAATVYVLIGGAATAAAVIDIYKQTFLVGAPAALVLAVALTSGAAAGLFRGAAWAVLAIGVHLVWLRVKHPAELAVLKRIIRRPQAPQNPGAARGSEARTE